MKPDGRARMVLDPRDGDAEDDVAAMQTRSLAAIAGGMLAEISPIKLVVTFCALVLAPAAVVGFAPLVATAWLSSVSAEVQALTTFGALLALIAMCAAAWGAWRPLLRLAESNFWTLNAVLVQPAYLVSREIARSLSASAAPRAAPGLAAKLLAGASIALPPLAIAWLALPHTRWIGAPHDLIRPEGLIAAALANALVVMMGYAAAAGAVWSFGDAATARTADLAPDEPLGDVRIRRIAHLSDLHTVGERYGFRIESGRLGPRGNERLEATFAALAAEHAREPLDHLVISGDMTDAGRSAEWAEFLDVLDRHPELAAIASVVPGNHDINIIDRANPARLEAPWAASQHRRRIRVLSAMDAVQGGKAMLVGADGACGVLLRERVSEARERLRDGALGGGWRARALVREVWDDCFPNMLPPENPDGLGVLLLDSNAQAHFSFTNALGLLSVRQLAAVEAALGMWPQACWLVVLHHHVVEYPKRDSTLSVRIGTALINGHRVARALAPHARRIVVMHGHRHVDWVGRHGDLRIVSAPSPVMNQPDHLPGLVHILRLQTVGGALRLLASEPLRIPPVRPEPSA